MNKKLLTIAVVTAMATPMLANAEAKSAVYAKVHVAGEIIDDGNDTSYSIAGNSSKASNVGVKGEIDTNLMDLKAIAQIEIGLDQDSNTEYTGQVSAKSGSKAGLLYQRDSWVGLSSKSMGTVRMGTIKTSYKQSGTMIDPLYTTALEGRGFNQTMSSQLHGGTGNGRGRSTHTVRYDSPDMGGAKVIANYNANPTAEDNMGLGVHWKGGPAAAFLDFQLIGEDNYVTDKNGKADTGNAVKVGGKYTAGDIMVSGQYEIDGGAISGNSDGSNDRLFLAGEYTMGATSFVATFGMAMETDNDEDDNTAFGLAVKQKLAKKVTGYAGWGMATGGKGFNNDDDISAFAVGLVAGF